MVIRVAVVDDDDVSRRGLVELLGDQAEVEVIGLTHVTAATWAERWDSVDVAIVDACDERRTDDQFPGVAVVEAIRRRRGPERTRVIVRTGQFFDDAVRHRMREARADYFFHRSELQDVGSLRDVVLHPERFRPGVPDVTDPAAVQRLGVGPSTRVNRAVAAAVEIGVAGFLPGQTLPGQTPPGQTLPGQTPPGQAVTSRSLARRRRRFNESARLFPLNSDGTVPDRNQADPSMPQIVRFLQWATRSKTGGT